MDDANIKISQLCDADQCALNELLKDDRMNSSIEDLKEEYENWYNNIEPTHYYGDLNCVIAYVDNDQMWFFPFTTQEV